MRILAVLLLPVLAASAGPTQRAAQIGDRYAVMRLSDTSSEDNQGGSGSTHDIDSFVERVVGISDAGIEVEFDLPDDTSAEDRARQWHMPARILKPAVGALQLLNKTELEARLAVWLKAGEMTREACGRWIFTWNAFQIDCEPQSVVEAYSRFDLSRETLQDGGPYRAPQSRETGVLRRTSADSYIAEMPVDPETVRRGRAETDVFVAELYRKPLTLAAALRARAKEEISGSISVTFDLDPAGIAWRRKEVTKLKIKSANGKIENQVSTVTVERKLLPRST